MQSIKGEKGLSYYVCTRAHARIMTVYVSVDPTGMQAAPLSWEPASHVVEDVEDTAVELGA